MTHMIWLYCGSIIGVCLGLLIIMVITHFTINSHDSEDQE